MPIIVKDRRTTLEKSTCDIATLFTKERFKEFKMQLTEDELNTIPDMAGMNVGSIIEEMNWCIRTKTIELKTYRSRYPFSKAWAYTKGKNIHFNSRKNHTIKSMIRTVAHELVHIADSHNPVVSYGHGNNFNQDQKQNCAPQMIAQLFENFYNEEGLLTPLRNQ